MRLPLLTTFRPASANRSTPRARFYQADLRDAVAVRGVIERERPEVLVHLAAQMDVRRSVADPAFDAQVNLVGFLNLMEAGREHGLRRVVFSSTGGAIYGEQECYPCDEEHPRHPVSPYGVAKLATEKYLFFYRAQYGIDYVALRYANVYGPRQDPHGEAGVVAIFCGRILEGRPVTIYGDGGQTRDYVFVADVVRGQRGRGYRDRIGRFQYRNRGGNQRQPALRDARQRRGHQPGGGIRSGARRRTAPIGYPARAGREGTGMAPASGVVGWPRADSAILSRSRRTLAE